MFKEIFSKVILYFLSLFVVVFLISNCEEIPIHSATLQNHCTNHMKDFDETGQDCGGSQCPACTVVVPCTPPDNQMTDGTNYYSYNTIYVANHVTGSEVALQNPVGYNLSPHIYLNGAIPTYDLKYTIVGGTPSNSTVRFSFYNQTNSTTHYCADGVGYVYLTHVAGKPVFTFCQITDLGYNFMGKIVCP